MQRDYDKLTKFPDNGGFVEDVDPDILSKLEKQFLLSKVEEALEVPDDLPVDADGVPLPGSLKTLYSNGMNINAYLRQLMTFLILKIQPL